MHFKLEILVNYAHLIINRITIDYSLFINEKIVND